MGVALCWPSSCLLMLDTKGSCETCSFLLAVITWLLKWREKGILDKDEDEGGVGLVGNEMVLWHRDAFRVRGEGKGVFCSSTL